MRTTPLSTMQVRGSSQRHDYRGERNASRPRDAPLTMPEDGRCARRWAKLARRSRIACAASGRLPALASARRRAGPAGSGDARATNIIIVIKYQIKRGPTACERPEKAVVATPISCLLPFDSYSGGPTPRAAPRPGPRA
ncbi:hypothetical protein EVAR_97289_1 [Eumeta japonica]|uniref:Uncharacterized protein n=1 Tax=Eumeta variegata TaxID=151549 RepID=A0A4C1XI01_EUMVA|nr:hypothetical protein EVAR_97289_1 [Eumeta japonica]